MKPLRRLSDREVHQRLVAASEELEQLAGEAWSVAGATALRVTAKMLRAVSSGFFLGMGSHRPPDEEISEK